LERLGIMTDLADPRPAAVTARPPRSYVLDIVIPVCNEERDLPGSVQRLHQYLAGEVPYAARITIADTAANRAFTFGIRGRTGVARHPIEWSAGLRILFGDNQRVAVGAAPVRPDGGQGGGAVRARSGESCRDADPIRRSAKGFQHLACSPKLR